MSFIRALRPDEVVFMVTPIEEPWPPDESDLSRKARPIWEWCSVSVTATWNGYGGAVTIGGCSHKSMEDFIDNGGYYEDMCVEALNNLQEKLEMVATTLSSLMSHETVLVWLCEQTHDS